MSSASTIDLSRNLGATSRSELHDQLQRLHRSLVVRAARWSQSDTPTVLWGPKIAHSVHRPSAGLCARFLVPKKPSHLPASQRIPPTIPLRLRRDDGKYDIITIVTDILPIAGQFVPTGARVLARESALTGVTLSWHLGGPWQWGLLTVGHLFAGQRLPLSVRVERIATPVRAEAPWIEGRVAVRAQPAARRTTARLSKCHAAHCNCLASCHMSASRNACSILYHWPTTPSNTPPATA
ncbi:MAG: hypothetical protein R3E01_14160 [Pirellulaceae bacterium]